MLGILWFATGCSTRIPSPLGTGSIYEGTLDTDHVGIKVVFPWATHF